MHKVAGRSRQGIVVAVQGDLVAHAGVAQRGHADAGVDYIREADRAEVRAARGDHKADQIAIVDIEHARFDQEVVHRRIKIRVKDHISGMRYLTPYFARLRMHV